MSLKDLTTSLTWLDWISIATVVTSTSLAIWMIAMVITHSGG